MPITLEYGPPPQRRRQRWTLLLGLFAGIVATVASVAFCAWQGTERPMRLFMPWLALVERHELAVPFWIQVTALFQWPIYGMVIGSFYARSGRACVIAAIVVAGVHVAGVSACLSAS